MGIDDDIIDTHLYLDPMLKSLQMQRRRWAKDHRRFGSSILSSTNPIDARDYEVGYYGASEVNRRESIATYLLDEAKRKLEEKSKGRR